MAFFKKNEENAAAPGPEFITGTGVASRPGVGQVTIPPVVNDVNVAVPLRSFCLSAVRAVSFLFCPLHWDE